MANDEVIKIQHFLPRCYLNGFVNSTGKVITLNLEELIKYNKIPQPKEYTPAQFCYENDFYTLEEGMESFGVKDIEDKYYIEKKFNQYERKYQNLIDKIRISQILTIEDARFLVHIIFDIKFRNKYFREKIVAPQQAKMVNDASDEIKELIINDDDYIGKYEGLTREEVLTLSESMRERLSSDPDFKKKAHLSAIYRQNDGYSEALSLTKEKFLHSTWQIMESEGQFISKDNPGSSIDAENKINNFLTTKDFLFFMPLTSSICFSMSSVVIDVSFNSSSISKNLNKVKAEQLMIDASNNSTLHHFNKYIYGSDLLLMKDISKNLHLNSAQVK